MSRSDKRFYWGQRLLSSVLGRISIISTLLFVIGAAAGAYYLFGLGGTHAHSTAPAAASTLTVGPNGTIFTIDLSSSEATFTMDEVLFGQTNVVVGKTSHVAGQIVVDRVNPSLSQVGQIKVDLTSLLTDNDFRNQAIQNRILETNIPGNQYASFISKSLTGLPTSVASIAIGTPIAFQITSDLTIHQVTRSETFAVRLTVLSASKLQGTAQMTIKYADFNISLPSVPSVTEVDDSVVLALNFTANAGS